jgi:hypothetical protein
MSMNLQIVEAAPTVIPFQMDLPDAAPVAGYQAVRFNAMKHGILSKLAVLAHEDHAEFDDLLAALIDEHKPAGITERHLIEELATIIWRKRRVLLAEGAKINEGLESTLSSPKSVTTSAAPFQRGLSAETCDLQDLLMETPEQIAETRRMQNLIWRQPARRRRSCTKAARMPTTKHCGRCDKIRATGGITGRRRGVPGDR